MSGGIPVDNSSLYSNIVETICHSIALTNRNFLAEYGDYIIHDWKSYYVCFDLLQLDYKRAKDICNSPNSQAYVSSEVAKFEILFIKEIRKFTGFISGEFNEISKTLDEIVDDFNKLTDAAKRKLRDEEQKTTYRIIRDLFIKQERLGKFFKLNVYICNKLGKKFDKLLQKIEPTPLRWDSFDSYKLFEEDRATCIADSESIREKIIETYSKLFREDYHQLAEGELAYFKSKEGDLNRLPYWIGLKCGMVVTLIAWITVDSMLIHSEFYFWTTPGLYVFSSIGSIVVFKLLWVLCVWMWSSNHVNYMVILQTSNSRPNTAVILNHSMDICIAYFACLIYFYRVNSLPSTAQHPIHGYIAPLLLILGFTVYCLLSLFNPTNHDFFHIEFVKQSTGIFRSDVLWRSLIAPFSPISFPDTFAADALTSFTRIISDSLYATCWIVSGSFLKSPTESHLLNSHFGSDHMTCTNKTMSLTVSLFMIVPLWIRLAQCCRAFYDNSSWQKRVFPWFPHAMNAMKYSLSAFVVLYSVFLQRVDSFFLFLIIFTAFYKWFWDVIVDWGMLDSLRFHGKIFIPGQYPFLRPNLMYIDCRFYYFAIVADLILRFLWVISLAPASLTQGFAKSALQMLMGTLEIFRRCLWSILRVENEHVTKLYGHALGVVLEKKKMEMSTVASQMMHHVRMNTSANLTRQHSFRSLSSQSVLSRKSSGMTPVASSSLPCDSQLSHVETKVDTSPLSVGSNSGASLRFSPNLRSALAHTTDNSYQLIHPEDAIEMGLMQEHNNHSAEARNDDHHYIRSRSYSLASTPALIPIVDFSQLRQNSNADTFRSKHTSHSALSRSSSLEWPDQNHYLSSQYAIHALEANAEQVAADAILPPPPLSNSSRTRQSSLSSTDENGPITI